MSFQPISYIVTHGVVVKRDMKFTSEMLKDVMGALNGSCHRAVYYKEGDETAQKIAEQIVAGRTDIKAISLLQCSGLSGFEIRLITDLHGGKEHNVVFIGAVTDVVAFHLAFAPGRQKTFDSIKALLTKKPIEVLGYLSTLIRHPSTRHRGADFNARLLLGYVPDKQTEPVQDQKVT